MKLCLSYRTIGQSHVRESLSLSPTALAAKLPKTRYLPDGTACCEGFRPRNLTPNLERHAPESYQNSVWRVPGALLSRDRDRRLQPHVRRRPTHHEADGLLFHNETAGLLVPVGERVGLELHAHRFGFVRL